MTVADWGVGYAKTLGALLNGRAISERDRAGTQITDDSFFLIFNAYHESMAFKLPRMKWGRQWTVVVDTTQPIVQAGARSYSFREDVEVSGRAMIVLRRRVS
jgi:glycogen operon protein